MKIRKFSENDFPLIVDIYSKSKLHELRFEQNEFELLPLENDTKRLAELKESDIYVYEDGHILGYGALFGSEIRALFVHPTSRGKGVGKSLFEFLLSKVTGLVILYVAKTNAPAKKFYNNYGFKVIDEFQTTYNGRLVCANKMVREVNHGYQADQAVL